jgi:hypothetical protein
MKDTPLEISTESTPAGIVIHVCPLTRMDRAVGEMQSQINDILNLASRQPRRAHIVDFEFQHISRRDLFGQD